MELSACLTAVLGFFLGGLLAMVPLSPRPDEGPAADMPLRRAPVERERPPAEPLRPGPAEPPRAAPAAETEAAPPTPAPGRKVVVVPFHGVRAGAEDVRIPRKRGRR